MRGSRLFVKSGAVRRGGDNFNESPESIFEHLSDVPPIVLRHNPSSSAG